MKRYTQLSLVPILLGSPLPLLAGDLEPSAAPATYSGYTIKDICNRLDTGEAGTQSTFAEPTAAPGPTGCTLDEVMTKAPALDTDGAAITEVLSGKKFWGLKNGEWGIKTGTATIATNPASVHATGESGSTGVAWPNPRFTVNGDNNNDGDCSDSGETCDGTVTDNLTGLIWLKNANCTETLGGIDPTASSNKLTWANALTWIAALGNGGCGLSDSSNVGDWRLPSVNELQSLVHYGFFSPAVPNTAGTAKWTTDGQPFSSVQASYYWSSTTDASNATSAWYVSLVNGLVYTRGKNRTNYVWPVRGGQ